MEKFEEIITKMSKPEIKELKHEELLAKAITNSKRKSALSFWWIIIPLYVIAAFIMKSMYNPKSSFRTNLNELTIKEGYTAALIFIVVPIILIFINLLSIKNIYSISKNISFSRFIASSLTNIVVILLSLLIIIIYLL